MGNGGQAQRGEQFLVPDVTLGKRIDTLTTINEPPRCVKPPRGNVTRRPKPKLLELLPRRGASTR